MKSSQKLKIVFENYTAIVRFDELDAKLLPMARRLELEGDRFGGIHEFDGIMSVSMCYAGGSKDGIPEAKIFGYPADEFMAKQYK